MMEFKPRDGLEVANISWEEELYFTSAPSFRYRFNGMFDYDIFRINGVVYTKDSEEFREAFNKELLWKALSYDLV